MSKKLRKYYKVFPIDSMQQSVKAAMGETPQSMEGDVLYS